MLSHEVQEWINDPYVTNFVPAWSDPAAEHCFNDLLEVGDAVEFLPTPASPSVDGRTYHVTDVAGISWFAHDVPSRELGGRLFLRRQSEDVLDALLTQGRLRALLRQRRR